MLEYKVSSATRDEVCCALRRDVRALAAAPRRPGGSRRAGEPQRLRRDRSAGYREREEGERSAASQPPKVHGSGATCRPRADLDGILTTGRLRRDSGGCGYRQVAARGYAAVEKIHFDGMRTARTSGTTHAVYLTISSEPS